MNNWLKHWLKHWRETGICPIRPIKKGNNAIEGEAYKSLYIIVARETTKSLFTNCLLGVNEDNVPKFLGYFDNIDFFTNVDVKEEDVKIARVVAKSPHHPQGFSYTSDKFRFKVKKIEENCVVVIIKYSEHETEEI